jgi:hypothetical protein
LVRSALSAGQARALAVDSILPARLVRSSTLSSECFRPWPSSSCRCCCCVAHSHCFHCRVVSCRVSVAMLPVLDFPHTSPNDFKCRISSSIDSEHSQFIKAMNGDVSLKEDELVSWLTFSWTNIGHGCISTPPPLHIAALPAFPFCIIAICYHSVVLRCLHTALILRPLLRWPSFY